MSLFDTVKCSYNIGELTNVECQSKNIDDWGGTCSFYWVDPAGRLWTPSYAGTYDFVETDKKEGIRFLDTVPNGNHGKYQHVPMTRCVEIYRCQSQADGYPECSSVHLEFYRGQLMDYMYK